MTYTYAIQWIDHGGPYDEPQWENHVPTALKQMGFDADKIILNIGGLKLSNGELYGYIKTNTPLPEWDGMYVDSDRWVNEIVLWFYTWRVKPQDIAQYFDLYDFEEATTNLPTE
tara:strand:- start:47 stop:388 length:342 start_codon:yes stop_codon:yes gene_type:complete